jgi:hypothetical protein
MVRRPPDPEVIVFLDENLDGETVAVLLRAGNIPFRRLSEEFDRSTADADWMPKVAARGWVIASRDNRIRYRPAELAALRGSGAILVVIRGTALRGETLGRLLVDSYPALCRLVARYQPPIIAHIHADGRLTMSENGGRRGAKR